MTSFNFLDEWPGKIEKIEFAHPKPLLPASTNSFLCHAGLPQTFAIQCSIEMAFTVQLNPVPLATTWREQVSDWVMPHDWARFWRLGDLTFTQGSAWICIEEVTGRIFGVDVGRDAPIFRIADSICSLAAGMLHWVRWYQRTGGDVTSIDELRTSFENDTDVTDDEFEAFWGLMIDSELDSGTERFVVAYN